MSTKRCLKHDIKKVNGIGFKLLNVSDGAVVVGIRSVVAAVRPRNDLDTYTYLRCS